MHTMMITIDEKAWHRLRRASQETGRSPDALAEAAVEEAALRWEQSQPGSRLSDFNEWGRAPDPGLAFLRAATPEWMK